MNPDHNTTAKKPAVKDSVLKRITREQVRPTSRWIFLGTRGLFWFAWIITLVLGALTIAEVAYMGMHSGVEYYDLTHGTMFSFLLDSLPYVWIVAGAVTLGLAHRVVRQLPRGYRYRCWEIVLVSAVLTIGLGVLLHVVGTGKIVDEAFDVFVPGYLSMVERQMYVWENPEAGRITGRYTGSVNTTTVRFVDSSNNDWLIDVTEVVPEQQALLRSGEQVRLLGSVAVGSTTDTFYCCGVTEWMPEPGHSLKTLWGARHEVEEMIEEQQEHAARDAAMLCGGILSGLLTPVPR